MTNNEGARMELERHIIVREVEDGKSLADPIFARRYRETAPDFPYHVIAFHRFPDGVEVPVCYIHFSELGDCLLGGGACVDDRVLRRMSAEGRAVVRDAGGLYHLTLAWSVQHFATRCLAIFGYCGDALAERVDLSVGFVRTVHPRLLVYFMRELAPSEQARLIAEAHAVGPF